MTSLPSFYQALLAPLVLLALQASRLHAASDLGALMQNGLAGDVSAQLRLALHYENKRPPKPYAAFTWFLRAAEQGEPAACHRVAKAYATGQGISQSSEKAAEWYEKAALRGDAVAMAKLGELLSESDSPKPLLSDAHAWLALAVENNEPLWTAKRDEIAKRLNSEQLAAAASKRNEFRAKFLPKGEGLPNQPPDPPQTRGNYTFPQGHAYEGGLKDGLPHGYGRMKTKDGELFYGEFLNGTPYGFGTHFSAQGFILFSGIWNEGKAAAGYSPQANLRKKLLGLGTAP